MKHISEVLKNNLSNFKNISEALDKKTIILKNLFFLEKIYQIWLKKLAKQIYWVSLAISGIIKNYKIKNEQIKTLETKYDDDAGDWYVALGWEDKRAIIKMDSVLATIIEIKEI